MTETDRRVDATMIALRVLRVKGILPHNAPASAALMALVSEAIGEPVSESTFHRLQRRALRRAKLSALALDALPTTPTNNTPCQH